MHAGALHADAAAHGVDAVVIRLHGHLGALAGHTHYVLDGNQAVVNFRHLGFEEAFQEDRRSAAEDDGGVVVAHFHLQYHGAHRVALAEAVARNLFGFGQDQLYLLLVEDKDLFVPRLIDLAHNHLAHFLLIFLEDQRLLVVLNLAHEVLADGQNLAAAEVVHIDRFGEFLAHFKIGLYLDGLAVGNLHVLILHGSVLDDGAVAENFQVALVDVHDDVEILVGAEALGQCRAEHLFEDVHQSLAVYVLQFFEFREGINQL